MLNKQWLFSGVVGMLPLTSAGEEQVGFPVIVDTSPLIGTTGYIDLQFIPFGDAYPALVTITDFLTDGTLAPTSENLGGATGSLPGPPIVSIANTTGFNDLFQGITFGNTITFNAAFTGAALTPIPPFPENGTVFALSLYDFDGIIPLLTTSDTGSMLNLNIEPSGSVTVEPFADADGIFRATVPEPTTLMLVGMGASVVVIKLHRRKRA